MSNRTVLVTGATGFVASRTLGPLARRGFAVHAVGRSRPKAAIDGFHQADLRDRARMRAVLRSVRPTHLLHCAWYVAHNRFWNAPENLEWIDISINLAREAVEAGLNRLVGIGSCAEYDWADGGATPRKESDPVESATLYGQSKVATFSSLQGLLAPSGVSFAWARLFHLFGPGESAGRLVPSVAGALLAGREAMLGPGRYRRDFMDVADAGDALAALVESPVAGAVNIASGTSFTIGQIAARLGELTGRPDLLRLDALEPRVGDSPEMKADIGRLVLEVGYQPRDEPLDGLGRCVEELSRRQSG